MIRPAIKDPYVAGSPVVPVLAWLRAFRGAGAGRRRSASSSLALLILVGKTGFEIGGPREYVKISRPGPLFAAVGKLADLELCRLRPPFGPGTDRRKK